MSQPIAAGTKFMQEVNAAAILGLLRDESPLSVATIAERVGLSRQAVTRSLTSLADDGYVEFSEPDRGAQRTGRPPQMVRFRSEAGYVVGLDVRPKRIRISVADLNGDEIAARVEEDGLDWDLPGALASAIERLLVDADISRDQVWHATVSAPGIVNPETGSVVLIPGMPSAVGGVLVATVREALGCPVDIDNDVKLATQGERWRGRPRDESAFVFVDWGEQIGAGIVIGGELHRGFSNDAGDIGYLDLVVPPSVAATAVEDDLGPFEGFAGSRALLRIASEANGGSTQLNDVVDGFAAGQEWAVSAVRTIAQRFALGVSVLRAVIDPETVVIGGEMSILFGDALAELLRDALSASPLAQPRIEVSLLGDGAVIRGAIHQSLLAVQRGRFDIQSLTTTVV